MIALCRAVVLLAVTVLAVRAASPWVAAADGGSPVFTVQPLPPCGEPLDPVQQVAVLYGIDWTTRIANVTIHAAPPERLGDNAGCSNVSFCFVDDATSASSPHVSAAALAFYLSTLESYVLETILFFRSVSVSGNVAPFPEPNPSPLPTPIPYNEGTVTFCATTANATVSPASFATGLARFLDVLDSQVQVLNASTSPSGSWDICFALQDSAERPARRSTAALLAFSGTEVLALASGIEGLTSSVSLASIVQEDPFVLAANATSVMITFDTNVSPALANEVLSPVVSVDRMWAQQGGAAGSSSRSAVAIALPPGSVTTQQLACLVAVQEDGVDNGLPPSTGSSGVIVWLLVAIVVLAIVGISVVWVLTSSKESRTSEKALLRSNQEA